MKNKKTVSNIKPTIELVEPKSEETTADLISEERTMCDEQYHLDRGISIGGGMFKCDFCKKSILYKDKKITEYV